MRDLSPREVATVPVGMDQEEVAYAFAQKDFVSAPVVDDVGRLIGVITVDDVVDVIHEEAEEDLMRLGGVTETDIYEAALDTGKARFSWLFVNLLTAILASIVIGFFEATIERIVILAVLMPIAASMGGNAGTQSLTVAVRGIAMRDLTSANAWRVLSKEGLVGLMNGVLFALIVGLVAWVWSGESSIGLVMAAAMAVTMVIAGLAGTAIPFCLSRTAIDPAVASGVLLTTITDAIAFLAFLGLAAWWLLWTALARTAGSGTMVSPDRNGGMTAMPRTEPPRGWPAGRPLAISFHIMCEAWPDDAAPGVGPMGNPIRAGVLDTQARSWARYGMTEGAWRLLDIVAEAGIPCTTYANGIVAERWPELLRRIDGDGHAIGAHAWSQNILPVYQDRESEERDLVRGIEAFEACIRKRPEGFISPRGTSSESTAELLAKHGFRWTADTFDADLPYLTRTAEGPARLRPVHDGGQRPADHHALRPRAGGVHADARAHPRPLGGHRKPGGDARRHGACPRVRPARRRDRVQGGHRHGEDPRLGMADDPRPAGRTGVPGVSDRAPIPVHVLAGFLGSGKTTLLNRLLASPEFGDSAVIVNEFGAIAVDHAMITEAAEETMILKSGCICCSVRGDLVDSLSDLAGRRNAGTVPPFARVIVETTGLADPGPILQTLATDPALVGRYEAGSVTATVDAVNGPGQIDRHEEARRQIAAADRIVLTKLDIADADAESALKEKVTGINPTGPILPRDAVDAEMLTASAGPCRRKCRRQCL